MGTRWLWILALDCVACGPALHDDTPDGAKAVGLDSALAAHETPAERARGAFSCDFGMPGDMPLDLVAPQIERDRMFMSERPGMIQKHIPLSFDTTTGNLFAGGRYLFRTRKQAADYHTWVEHEFVLDGVLFLQRPYFLAPECHDWEVVGHADFADDLADDAVMRTERFSIDARTAARLPRFWPAIAHEAWQRGYTRVSLLVNAADKLASLVYFAGTQGTPEPTAPDFASLQALASETPLGATLDALGLPRTFDRTQWVLTVWFPYRKGDRGPASIWNNSPPFPAPTCGDGVCEPSRGETPAGCSNDCSAHCGNAVCNAGETNVQCPSDCRL